MNAINLNLVNFIILSGLFQTMLLAGALFFINKEKSLLDRLLSIIILIVSLHLIYFMILDTNLDNLYPFLLYIPYSFTTAIGPLTYFYTKEHTDSHFNIRNVNQGHFIPVLIEVLLQAFVILNSIFSGQMTYNTPFYFSISIFTYIWTAGSIWYYLRLSLDLLNKHESWALSNYSDLKPITLSWLKRLIIYYRVLWMIWIPFVSLFLIFFKFQLQYLAVVLVLYSLILLLTYLTMWIGLEGFRKGNHYLVESKDNKSENKNFKLTSEEMKQIADGLCHQMSIHKLYRKENLSLRNFAEYLKIDPNLISFVLNKHLNKNFHDFVNQYRIDEVKNRIGNPAYKHLTILGIAMESGFNSKATFNRVFKKFTGKTPSQFLKEKKQK